MKAMKSYPIHPCICCGTPTNYKSYCAKHLAIALKTTFIPLNKHWMDSEAVPSPKYRRMENKNSLR